MNLSGFKLAFDGAGSSNFGNDHTRNVLIAGIAKRSSSHAENCKNNFLELGKRTTKNTMGSVCEPKQNASIKFSKRNTKFCLSLHYNHDNCYLFVNGKESYI